MNISSYILEQALRRLQVPESSIRQFALASALSDVGGRGFPRELFALSAPVVVRGLLNFAVFQMRRDWIFPYWVRKQLDPDDPAYIARSQNPIFVNTTHRNWTTLGSPHGLHEAIVDPRGMATPLPREWSLEVWLTSESGPYFPSTADTVEQTFSTTSPILRTRHAVPGFDMQQEHFVSSTRDGLDVLFQEVSLQNISERTRAGTLAIVVRPYNSEGIAPISHLSTDGKRFLYVDHLLGIVFSREPDRYLLSSGAQGDLAGVMNTLVSDPDAEVLSRFGGRSIRCPEGLGHAAAIFPFSLAAGEQTRIHCSVALANDALLRKRHLKQTWQVSYETRRMSQEQVWNAQRAEGARIAIGNARLQSILDANTLALLQLNDKDFISPGPYLYHHFWYRDAVPMCRALDALGFHERSRMVYNGFPKGQTRDGFFRGPDGEWDSNGAVLFGFLDHYRFTRSSMWLRGHFSDLLRGGNWVIRQRKKTSDLPVPARGLLPRSLSAEHLGTVDQYYWDTFHGLAGMRSLVVMSSALGHLDKEEKVREELQLFEEDVRTSLQHVATRLGRPLIPATPTRTFDESAIGSLSGIYPLGIHDVLPEAFKETTIEILERYVDPRGFLHPFIHSGYNMYLTLHIAQALRLLGLTDLSGPVGASVIDQCRDPYTFPEAIHPRTGGGAMGDGHHGWAAAEVVLWLRSMLIEESDNLLSFFRLANGMLGVPPTCSLTSMPTHYGPIDLVLKPDGPSRYHLQFSPRFHSDVTAPTIEFWLPLEVRRVLPSNPQHLINQRREGTSVVLRCRPQVRSIVLECE